MIEVDGGYGEGGGQIVRIAAALSLCTQQPVRIRNIRAKREVGGLRPQHLSSLKILTELSETKITGLRMGSREVEIIPGKITGGKKKINIGTAGSIALLLQTVLLPSLLGNEGIELTIIGGTDVARAPTIDYLMNVLFPMLRKIGGNAEIWVERRGFYPAGGGIVHLSIQPSKISHWICTEPHGSLEICGKIVCSGLPEHVVKRMKHAALNVLLEYHPKIDSEYVQASCPGVSITLWGKYENTVLGASNIGEKGVPAEEVGDICADELKRNLSGECTVDSHMCDQLLPFLAFSDGESRFVTRYVSLHAETVAWVLRQFTNREIEFVSGKENVVVKVR
ncbi:MAG: RNA 3'-terminal phosphate cyclase [Thermoplasmata archaeon]